MQVNDVWNWSIRTEVHIFTWHHHKRSLRLHGNQAGTENGGRISSGQTTHTTCLPQLTANRMQRMLAQQHTPVWERKREFNKLMIFVENISQADTPFSSPWPSLPKRPITILHGSEVIWIMPTHHSHNFWRPIFRGENFGRRALWEMRDFIDWNWNGWTQMNRRYLLGTSMLMTQVSSSSPCWSVQDTRIQRWSCDRQYPTNNTLQREGASEHTSPASDGLLRVGARMKGGEYRRTAPGLWEIEQRNHLFNTNQTK